MTRLFPSSGTVRLQWRFRFLATKPKGSHSSPSVRLAAWSSSDKPPPAPQVSLISHFSPWRGSWGLTATSVGLWSQCLSLLSPSSDLQSDGQWIALRPAGVRSQKRGMTSPHVADRMHLCQETIVPPGAVSHVLSIEDGVVQRNEGNTRASIPISTHSYRLR